MSEESVCYKRSDIIDILRDLNMMVVSLDRIGSEYSTRKSDEEYLTLTSNFIDDWDITRKLARMRQTLSDAFSYKLGEDDMDELEREFQNLRYWSKKKPLPD